MSTREEREGAARGRSAWVERASEGRGKEREGGARGRSARGGESAVRSRAGVRGLSPLCWGWRGVRSSILGFWNWVVVDESGALVVRVVLCSQVGRGVFVGVPLAGSGGFCPPGRRGRGCFGGRAKLVVLRISSSQVCSLRSDGYASLPILTRPHPPGTISRYCLRCLCSSSGSGWCLYCTSSWCQLVGSVSRLSGSGL
jgi:hypothetical protein